ncbi:MAG: hypothetical protein HYV36_03855 [Lentisphaerae bacterium]|nr:hypothetical protein [Lentisphaerota bacterium]
MESKTIERFRVVSRVIFFILLLLTGCVRLEPAIKKGMPAEAPRGLEIHTQYAVSTEPKLGYNTFEVYISNHTTNTIVFTGAELNGKSLPKVPPDKLIKSSAGKSTEGDFPKNGPATWWQYYPRNELKPGETVEFQANFKAQNFGRQELRLLTSTSDTNANSAIQNTPPQAEESKTCPDLSGIQNILVPRYRPPDKQITAITYSLDYKWVYLQYQPKSETPQKLWINQREVPKFTILRAPEPNAPAMLVCQAPFLITTGMPLCFKVLYADGKQRHALVRALNGVFLDCYALGSNKDRKDLALYPEDDVPVHTFNALGADVACHDVKSGEYGAGAAPIIAERLKFFQQRKNKLYAIHYCTAMYPELWNIYGQVADAAFANPYCLANSHKPDRFIDEEEKSLEKARSSTRPRPFLWIPEAFKQGQRFLELPELEVMTWMSIVRGCKGIKYFAYKFENNAGFADDPPLKEAIKRLNREVHGRQEILSPLALVSERTEGDEAKGYVKIYESWSGDKGILVMIRNLDYTTDAKSNAGGKEPRFKVKLQNGLNVTVSLPEWFEMGAVQQWRGSVKPEITRSGTTARINIKQLNEFEIIWMQNKNHKN